MQQTIPAITYVEAMERLIGVMQQLALAHDRDAICASVPSAARALTGADGATLMLRDGEQSWYANEDAITPLWKDLKLPLSRCIGGWAMTHRRPAAIPDLYADQRVEAAMYRPTFVNSLLVTPINTVDPLGAIGVYWSDRHTPTAEETKLLGSLADTVAIAMENVAGRAKLEAGVRECTKELETANADFDSFCHTVSHDLRAPIRAIAGFSSLIAREHATSVDAEMRRKLDIIKSEATRMGVLIEDLLTFSRIGRKPLRMSDVDMTDVVRRALLRRERNDNDRLDVRVAPLPRATADASMLEVVWLNLLSNAAKFSAGREQPIVEIGGLEGEEQLVYHIRDNGIGFDPKYAERIFEPFQRLHNDHEYPGSGMGLALVERIVSRHGGRLWAEAAQDSGATFYFSLPHRREPHMAPA